MKTPQENILQSLQTWAERTPDAEAIHVLARRPYSLTYRELHEGVCCMSRHLAERGVRAGDRVAILGNLDDRFFITLLAAASLQAVSVPINMESRASRHVLQAYAERHPFRLVCYTSRFTGFVKGVFPTASNDLQFMRIDSTESEHRPSDEDFGAWNSQIKSVSAESAFYVNTTSGSTSAPKMVEATHGQLIINTQACIEFFQHDETTRLLCVFCYHQHEHFFRPLMTGGCAVLLPFSSVGYSLVEACLAARVTHLLCNPHSAIALTEESDSKLKLLRPNLRTIEVGGGLISPQFAQRLQDISGARFTACYGATETGGEALVGPHSDEHFNRFLPLPGYTARIVDDEGNDVAPATVGELVISGPAVADSYVEPPPGQTQLTKDGFHTKDLAVRDDDGRIRVLGRCDNAVKMLGSRQPIEPIEQAITTTLGPMASIVQVLDIEPQRGARALGLGSSLVAIVRLSPNLPLSPAQQANLVRKAIRSASLEAFLTSPTSFLLAKPDEIGLTDTGKLRRRHARSLFPYLLGEWDETRRHRLETVRPTLRSIGRALKRVVLEASRVVTPSRALSVLARRIARSLHRNKHGGQRWRPSAKGIARLLLLILALYLLFIASLMAFEDRLVFQHGSKDARSMRPQTKVEYEDVWLTTSDGVRLHAIFCPCPAGSVRDQTLARIVVLYCHGNKGTVLHRLKVASDWQQNIGCDVLMFDYRGYGKSEGSPSEQGVYCDSRAAYRWLIQERQIPAEQVVIVGRSLGGAVALELANSVKHGALVLESTFTTLPDVANEKLPFTPNHWIMKNRFPSIERIRQHIGPVVIAHGMEDEVIAPQHGKRLFELANEPKLFHQIPTRKHMDLPTTDYYAAVRKFIEQQAERWRVARVSRKMNLDF